MNNNDFREPREFEYTRFLVDAAHWAGHKKMKRNQNKNVGGHKGCSEGKFIVCSNEHSIKWSLI